jgi:hypothetical protein
VNLRAISPKVLASADVMQKEKKKAELGVE